MPFEGLARSHSAEFIAAQRARTRSQSRVASPGAGEPETYTPSSQPALFITPSPVPAVLQRHEWPGYKDKRSSSTSSNSAPAGSGGSFPRRTLSRISGNSAAIPEGPNEDDDAAAAANAAAITQPSRAHSESSSRTLGADGDETLERDTQPVVGEPPLKKQALLAESKREKDLEKGRKGQDESNAEVVGEDGQQGGQEVKRKSTTQRKREFDEKFLVSLDGRGHLNPHNWSVAYRWFVTGLMGLFVLNATFASSGPSQLIPSIITYFGVSQEVGVLTIALFVAGYCVGPLFWGPLSERFGRKLVFIVAFFPYVCFQVGCALSPNIGALLAFRFLGGCFAASPLTNSGGVIADLWDADRRGIALAIFSLAPFAGPAIAPIVSGALELTGTDWRWIFWILAIFAGVCLAIIVFVVPETYVPYLLYKEAKRLRKETGDDRWHTAQEHPDHKVTFRETLNHTILKPFIMLFQEPMLMVMTLYLAFVYGIVYLLFEAIPIIFQETHGWNALEGGLAFLGLPIGGTVAVLVYAFYFNKVYMRKHHELKGKMVPPEERLKPLMVAAPAFAVSFFWVGWTYYPSINPASPLIAIALMGFAILFMFLSIFNYLIDSYLASAASALAINTVVRSAFGAGFPLFATQMYNKLGVPGASSLLGGLALVFLPVPFLLYKYGRKIRSMSKNAMVLDE